MSIFLPENPTDNPSQQINETDFIDLENILLHEITHYKRGDMFYKWLLQFTVCIHWFNPFIHLAVREINRACELSCDEAVISALGEGRRFAYGNTLIKSLEVTGRYHDQSTPIALNENKKLLKERLEAMKRTYRKSKAAAAITVIFSVFLCISATAAGAYSSTSFPSENIQQTNKKNPANISTSQYGIDMTSGGTYLWNTGISLINTKLVNMQNFAPSDFASVTVNYDAGLVRIHPSSTDNIIVKEYHTLDSNAYHAKISSSKNKLEILMDKHSEKNTDFISYIELFLPNDYTGNVDITTSSAQIDTSSYSGILNCYSKTGTIKISDSKINGTLSSISGEINLERCSGRISLNTYSGRISATNSNLSGKTVSENGKIELQLNTLSGNLDIQNASGDLLLYLPQDSSRSLIGTVGNRPEYSVSISSSTGSISLKQARLISKMNTCTIAGTVFYLIDTEEQLRSIGANPYTLGLNYSLNRDIALTKEWIPIGTIENPFTGTFNGNGYELQNLKVTVYGLNVYSFIAYAENADIYNVTLRDLKLGNDKTMNKTVMPFVGINLGGTLSYDNRIADPN